MTAALKHLSNVRVQPIELLPAEAPHDHVRTQCPEMLIVNPTFGDYFDITKLRKEISDKRIRSVALVTSFVDVSLLDKYDESISMLDDLEALSKEITGLLNVVSEKGKMDNQNTLSQQKKEIVICAVKEMTSKGIVERLFLSTHTAITHRRNVSRKLRTRSAVGLITCVIVDKPVILSDVKDL